MFAIPIDEFEFLNSSLLHRTPEFNRPRKHAEVFIGPCIKAAGDHLFGMVFEIMKDRDVRVARDLRALFADLLVGPQISSGKGIVGTVIIRP